MPIARHWTSGAGWVIQQALLKPWLIWDSACICRAIWRMPGKLWTRVFRLRTPIGYKRIAAVQTNTIGEIEMNLGHLTEAEKYDQKALATLNAIGDKSHAASALLDLALVSSMRGEADLARQRLEQAHRLWVELGDPVMSALARVAMQGVRLRDGKIPPDDKILSEAQEVFRARKLIDEQVWTSIVRTRFFLAKNLSADAKREAAVLDA